MKKIKSIKLSYRHPLMKIKYICNDGEEHRKSKIIDNIGLLYILRLMKSNCYDDIVKYMN